jgi:Protein of unknown function (DUF3306)
VADGFLGRWSRRKLDAKEGKPLEAERVRKTEPEQPSPQPSPASGRGSEAASASGVVGSSPSPLGGEGRGEGAPLPEPPPPPTLEDARALTPESDFTRFVKSDVPADVRNAAVKKLFADPHFNVMDGLDTYIDDYTKADPIPESMLRQLAAGRFLGLFREEERKDEPEGEAREDAEGQAPQSVAQSHPPAAPEPAADPQAVPPESHADPDLRLQQDDAARPGEAGRCTG